MTTAALRAYTSAVLRARAAYWAEIHCCRCGDFAVVSGNRAVNRECERCKGRAS